MVAAANERALEVLSVQSLYDYVEQLVVGYATRYQAAREAEAAMPTAVVPEGQFGHELACEYRSAQTTVCSLKVI